MIGMRTDPQAQAFAREQLSRRANLLRERLRMSEVVGRVVTLKRQGAEWFGLCPFHNESTASFTVNDRKRFCHCFGCGFHADAIGFVMARQGLGFVEALELLEAENGLRHLQAARPAPPAPKVEQREDAGKREAMLRIWNATVDLRPGSPGDRYYRDRGLLPPAEYGFGDASVNAGWPIDLRFHAELWHGLEKRAMPGMVAAFRRHDGTLVAIHRTYLKATGVSVTKAGTERDKAMLCDCKGAVIRLADYADAMLGGEGIETTLAAMQLFKRPGFAFGSRANMAAVDLPLQVSDFIYAADRNKSHSDPKRSRVGERAAWQGAKTFGQGRKISVQVPRLPAGMTGDFNDVLLMKRRGEWPSSAKASEGKPSGAPAPTAKVALQVLRRSAEDKRDLRAALRAAKAEEEAAFEAYCRATPREIEAATRTWKSACARTESLLQRSIA